MKKKQMILLIEDNDDHSELITRCFEENNFECDLIRKEDGESALKYLFENIESETNKKPDIILLDLRLPKIDGIEVLNRLKKSDFYKQTPVIVLSSSDAEADIVKAYSSHVNSYLVKPLDFTKFNQLINDINNYWLVVNKNPQI